jgi:hypothetical protein
MIPVELSTAGQASSGTRRVETQGHYHEQSQLQDRRHVAISDVG